MTDVDHRVLGKIINLKPKPRCTHKALRLSRLIMHVTSKKRTLHCVGLVEGTLLTTSNCVDEDYIFRGVMHLNDSDVITSSNSRDENIQKHTYAM